MTVLALPVTVKGFVIYDRHDKQLSLDEIAAALNGTDQSVRPTEKQAELLQFITRHIAETGVAPTYGEMVAAMGLHSRSGIFRLLTGLEERGLIRRLPFRARAIEVITSAGAA